MFIICGRKFKYLIYVQNQFRKIKFFWKIITEISATVHFKNVVYPTTYCTEFEFKTFRQKAYENCETLGLKDLFLETLLQIF